MKLLLKNLTVLEGWVGGFEGPTIYVKVDILEKRVAYKIHHQLKVGDSKERSKSILPWKMKLFLKQIEETHFWEWEDAYPNIFQICDGTQWWISYTINGQKVTKHGDNHFPDEWVPFCEALSRVTGVRFR